MFIKNLMLVFLSTFFFFLFNSNNLLKFLILDNNNYFFCNDYFNQFAYNFSYPKTSTMAGMIELHNYIMIFLFFILAITVFFLFAALYTSFYEHKLHFKQHDIYSRRSIKLNIYNYINNRLNLQYSHHPLLEFIWTLLPAVVLIALAYPSFILLYTIDACIDPIYTIIIIGNQWFWTYEYSDFDVYKFLFDSLEKSSYFNFSISLLDNFFSEKNLTKSEFKNLVFQKFILNSSLEKKIQINSSLLSEDRLPLGYPRLLSTDQVLVLPASTPIRLLITSNDVLHSWAVPSYGIKMDAVPGRLNQVYFYTEFFGTSWGQCSELCGVDHGFMPIEIRVLPSESFLYFINLKLNSLIKESYTQLILFYLKSAYKVSLIDFKI